MNSRVLVWISLCLIWGTTWLAIKVGLRDLPPFTFAAVRFAITSVVLGGIVLAMRRKIPILKEERKLIVISGVLGVVVNFGLVFWGEQYVSSGLASVLNATVPLFGMLIAHRKIPGERMTGMKTTGLIIGIGGVVWMFADQLTVEGSLAFAGSAGIVVGAVAVAYSSILVKLGGKSIDAIVMSAGQCLVGWPLLLLIGIATGERPWEIAWTSQAMVSVLYLAFVGSCVALSLYYWLIKRIPVTSALSIVLVVPIIAVSVGAFFNDEKITNQIITGGSAVLAGVGLIILATKRQGAKAAEEKAVLMMEEK